MLFFFFLFFFNFTALFNVTGLSYLFPICLNKNEISVVVVNKSVYVDFPSIVMSTLARLRTIRVPSFWDFNQNRTLNTKYKSLNDSLTVEGIPILLMWRKPVFCTRVLLHELALINDDKENILLWKLALVWIDNVSLIFIKIIGFVRRRNVDVYYVRWFQRVHH